MKYGKEGHGALLNCCLAAYSIKLPSEGARACLALMGSKLTDSARHQIMSEFALEAGERQADLVRKAHEEDTGHERPLL